MYNEIPKVNSKLTASIRLKNSTLLHRYPKLAYVPFNWGTENVKGWMKMKHEGTTAYLAEIFLILTLRTLDRLVMLNARAGTMPRATVVLPVELVWEDEEKVIQSPVYLWNLTKNFADYCQVECIQ